MLIVHAVGDRAQRRQDVPGVCGGDVFGLVATPSKLAIWLKVNASASGTACVRYSSAPAATNASRILVQFWANAMLLGMVVTFFQVDVG